MIIIRVRRTLLFKNVTIKLNVLIITKNGDLIGEVQFLVDFIALFKLKTHALYSYPTSIYSKYKKYYATINGFNSAII